MNALKILAIGVASMAMALLIAGIVFGLWFAGAWMIDKLGAVGLFISCVVVIGLVLSVCMWADETEEHKEKP